MIAHSSPVMCGMDYLQRTSADYPSALEMMKEVSERLGGTSSMFYEWSDPKSMTESIQQLLDNSSPKVKNEDRGTNEAHHGLRSELCSTQASSSQRPSLRTSIGSLISSSSTWTCFDVHNQWSASLTSFDMAEQYVFSCTGTNCGEESADQPLTYENCSILLQLSSTPTLFEVCELGNERQIYLSISQINHVYLQLQSWISKLAWMANIDGGKEITDKSQILANLKKMPRILKVVC